MRIFILCSNEAFDYYHLSGESAEWCGVFPKRANHRMYLSGSIRMERYCFTRQDRQLNGASSLAHGNVRHVFEPVRQNVFVFRLNAYIFFKKYENLVSFKFYAHVKVCIIWNWCSSLRNKYRPM